MRAFHLNEPCIGEKKKKKVNNLVFCVNLLFYVFIVRAFNRRYIRYHFLFSHLYSHINLGTVASARSRAKGSVVAPRSPASRLREFSAIKRNPFHIPHVAGLSLSMRSFRKVITAGRLAVAARTSRPARKCHN